MLQYSPLVKTDIVSFNSQYIYISPLLFIYIYSYAIPISISVAVCLPPSLFTNTVGIRSSSVILFTLYLVPLEAYLSSPKGLPESPQPTFMAILSLCLALWANGPQARLYLSVFSNRLEEELRRE